MEAFIGLQMSESSVALDESGDWNGSIYTRHIYNQLTDQTANTIITYTSKSKNDMLTYMEIEVSVVTNSESALTSAISAVFLA